MLAFLRVVVFYVGFAAFLTWAIFALGWADALELPGFEGGAQTPTATVPAVTPVIVPPQPDPLPKLSQPREIKLPPPEPRREAPVQAPPQVSAPVAQPPPAPQRVEVAATPAVVEPPRPAPPAAPPAPVVVAPPQPAPPVRTEPIPAAAPVPPAQPAQIAVQPAPPKAPAAPPPQLRITEAAPVASPPTRAPVQQPLVLQRRIAGFGADDFLDQLEETRRARDDAPCVMFRGVQFRAGTTVFAPGARTEIDTIARVLREFPAKRIEVGSKLGPGRPMATDSALRVDRAMLVRQTLISLGIDGERLTVDTNEAYERVADDVSRARGSRVQSIGLCMQN